MFKLFQASPQIISEVAGILNRNDILHRVSDKGNEQIIFVHSVQDGEMAKKVLVDHYSEMLSICQRIVYKTSISNGPEEIG